MRIVAPPDAPRPCSTGGCLAPRCTSALRRSKIGRNSARGYTQGVHSNTWLDFMLWLALGAFIGFRRGRTVFARRFFAATSSPESLKTFTRSGNPGKGRMRGYRSGMSMMYAVGGAVIAGLIFCGLQLLLHWLG